MVCVMMNGGAERPKKSKNNIDLNTQNHEIQKKKKQNQSINFWPRKLSSTIQSSLSAWNL